MSTLPHHVSTARVLRLVHHALSADVARVDAAGAIDLDRRQSVLTMDLVASDPAAVQHVAARVAAVLGQPPQVRTRGDRFTLTAAQSIAGPLTGFLLDDDDDTPTGWIRDRDCRDGHDRRRLSRARWVRRGA